MALCSTQGAEFDMSCWLTRNIYFTLGKLRGKQSCYPERCQVIPCQEYAFQAIQKNVIFCSTCFNSEKITAVTCFRLKLQELDDCQRRQSQSHQIVNKQKLPGITQPKSCSALLLGVLQFRGQAWPKAGVAARYSNWSCPRCEMFGAAVPD